MVLSRKTNKKVYLITILTLAVMLCASKPALSTTPLSIKLLYVIDSASSKTDYLSNPMDIFFDEEKKELYVVDVGKHRILIFDLNGRLSAEIKELGGIKTPVSIAVDKMGFIYLIDSQLKKVTILDYRGRLFDIFDGNELFANESTKPFKVFRNYNGDIFVMSSNIHLFQMNMETRKAEPFKLNINESKPELLMVLDVTTDNEGNFYFGDMRPGQIVVFDNKGNYLKRMGEPGSGDRQISRPTGVTVDKKGRVFVVSTVRHTILCYDSDGNFLREFGGMGRLPGYFYFPTKIVSDGDNRLYVLDSSLNRVQVFEVN